MTISDRTIIETLLQNNGVYPGDPQMARIYRYVNAMNPTEVFAVFAHESHDDMALSPAVTDAVLLFDRACGLTPAGQSWLGQKATGLPERGLLASGSRKAYALAGNATLTLQSKKTSQRFTYKIRRADDNGALWFVRVLTGPDNMENYQYLGVITTFKDKEVFRITGRSRISDDAPSAMAFYWFIHNWESDLMDVWHEGRCGRCGRRLTVPESIASGIGPTCAGYGGLT